MPGHSMNYDFGPKRQWRRWVWNRIAERTDNKRDALVLYLPGAADHDRPVAIAKGFRSSNMVGAERNSETLDALRKDGVLTIDGDVLDAAHALAKTRRVDVVFADLCGGLSAELPTKIVNLLPNPNLQHATFVFNLLRGRDPGSNTARAMLIDSFAIRGISEKHRGMHLLLSVICLIIHGTTELGEREPPWLSAEEERLLNLKYQYLNKFAAAAFTEYRSDANQTFDTVVFKNPLRELDMNDADFRTLDGRRATYSEVVASTGYYAEKARAKTARSTAAVMAHRTMRGNA